jgi:cystathionine beta-lyase
MKFDFDKVIDRRGTNCLKYDFAPERGKPADILPFWVADMDFQTAPAITERLSAAVSHGIFGYSEGKEDYFTAVANWYEKHFDWHIKRSWLVKTPGVVYALAMAVRAFTKPNDGVMIQQPVYYPFSEVILDNDRRLVNNSLKNVNGHYEIDFEDFERKILE